MSGPDFTPLPQLPQGPDIASPQDHMVHSQSRLSIAGAHTNRVDLPFVLGSDSEPYHQRVHLSFSMRIRKNMPPGASPYTAIRNRSRIALL